MPALSPCEQLLRATDPDRRESLLERAAQSPECLAEMLALAEESLPGAVPQALRATEFAIALAERRAAWPDSARAWRVRARAQRLLGQHAEAVTSFAAAAAAAERAGDPMLAARVQVGVIDSLGWLGRYDEALELAAQLEQQLLAMGAEQDAARVLSNVGGLHFRRDRYADALEFNQRALAILRRGSDAVSAVRTEANSANLLTYLGRIDEAIALSEQVRTEFTALNLAAEAAKIEGNIGYLHYVSGRYAAALGARMRARPQFAILGQEIEAAKADADLGDTYRALNLYPEAQECYARALETLDRFAVDDERARTGLGYAAVLMALERYDEAFAALERAEKVFRRHKNGLQRAQVRLMRAYLLRAVGETDRACREANAAAHALKRHNLPGWAAEARLLLADVARERGQGSVRALQSVARVARRTGRGWLHCRAERLSGILYSERGQVDHAIRHLRASVAALEQARTLVAPEELHVAFLRDKLTVYEDLVRVLLARGTPDDMAEALEYVERSKSRLLLERIQTALDNRPPVSEATLTATQKRLAALRAELSRAYHRAQPFDQDDARSLGGPAITAPELEALERSYRETLREVESSEADGVNGLTTLAASVTPSMLRAALEPDEALIEFYIIEGAVTAFIVTPQGLEPRVGIASLSDVEYALRRMRYQLQKAAVASDYVVRHQAEFLAGAQDALQRLYDLLIAPIEPLLQAQRLIIVPHGILHGLPFHACYDGAAYALDRWEMIYAPSASVWHLGVQKKRARATAALPVTSASALLMGVPWPGIERVAQEIDQIAGQLQQMRRFCGEEATLETFRAHAGQCRLIHLATHALFRADNPLFSGLRFADGWLLARDLYDMSLESDLVTLSACQTGAASVEAGDELFGLLRGFLNAGARSLAVSLWPADDEATAELMSLFYAELAQGVTKSGAMRAAQQALRQNCPHPYFWAAFVVVGER